MGAHDMLSGVDGLDEARMERERRVNPPEFAPGQADLEFDALFNDDAGEDNSSMSLDNFGDTGFGGGYGSMPDIGSQNQQSRQLTDDEIFDKGITFIKAFFKGVSEFVKAMLNTTAKFWAKLFAVCVIVGAVEIVLGFLCLIFGRKNAMADLTGGGFLLELVCISGLMLTIKKSRVCTSKYKDGGNADLTPSAETEFFMDEFETCAAAEEMPVEFTYEAGDIFEDVSLDELAHPRAGVSISEALTALVVPDKGMYTRQYLYETFTKVLENICCGFGTAKEISSESDVFLIWEKYLRDACGMTGVSEENLPNLNKLEETVFTIKLTFERPLKGFKPEETAREISNVYAYAGGEFNDKIYSKADAVGKRCIITIFKGDEVMISLKDMYGECEPFILDRKQYMPVVLGVDSLGKVIKFDFKKLESVLITGMPRSGKSWFVQAVLVQMCAFIPPGELNIYICDPKEGISDFKAFRLPHVKKFVSGDDNIVNTLRWVVKDLAPKRKKIIGDADCVNIWDYKSLHPDVKMPVIYVLIDEVVTLAERMEKETKQEFQGLLVELISQLPALGIRAFLIPHVVKDQIIAKTATDLIPCRISVCGDAGHIEASTGTKPRDFPYKLTNTGDMAVRMPAISAATLYVKAPAISDSNDKNHRLFDYLLKVWSKLEPEEVEDSVAANYAAKIANRKALEDLNSDMEF